MREDKSGPIETLKYGEGQVISSDLSLSVGVAFLTQ